MIRGIYTGSVTFSDSRAPSGQLKLTLSPTLKSDGQSKSGSSEDAVLISEIEYVDQKNRHMLARTDQGTFDSVHSLLTAEFQIRVSASSGNSNPSTIAVSAQFKGDHLVGKIYAGSNLKFGGDLDLVRDATLPQSLTSENPPSSNADVLRIFDGWMDFGNKNRTGVPLISRKRSRFSVTTSQAKRV